MDAKAAAFKAGMFVLAGMVAVLTLAFILSGAALHPGVKYETYFQESVQGIDIGTDVKFRGVTVGQVTDIGLATAEYPPASPNEGDQQVYQQVVVRFSIDPKKIGPETNIAGAIGHGLRIQIKPQGITGLSYLDLGFVNPQTYPVRPVPWVPANAVIPSVPSTLTQIQDAAEQVISSLSHADIAAMIANAGSLMATLHEEFTTGDAHQALAAANALLANLNTAVAQSDLPGTSEAVRNLAGGPQTRQIIVQLDQTTAQLAKITAQLPALVSASQATLNQANETTSDLQAQLIPILRSMKVATDNLRALSADLSRNPSQFILGAPPPPEGGH